MLGGSVNSRSRTALTITPLGSRYSLNASKISDCRRVCVVSLKKSSALTTLLPCSRIRLRSLGTSSTSSTLSNSPVSLRMRDASPPSMRHCTLTSIRVVSWS